MLYMFCNRLLLNKFSLRLICRVLHSNKNKNNIQLKKTYSKRGLYIVNNVVIILFQCHNIQLFSAFSYHIHLYINIDGLILLYLI